MSRTRADTDPAGEGDLGQVAVSDGGCVRETRTADRIVTSLFRAVTWGPLLLAAALVTIGLSAVPLFVEQSGLGTSVDANSLRGLLPGWFAAGDILHSLVFLVAALWLVAGLALTAADRLLANRAPDVSLLAEGLFWVGIVFALVFGLLHLFLYREVTVDVGPGEIVMIPALDVTLETEVTAWTPKEGSFGTVQFAPRLSSPELIGPFGDVDRSSEAKLAVDAVELQLGETKPVPQGDVRLQLSGPPPGWAARVRVSSGGLDEESPFLQSGQSWTSKRLAVTPPAVVGVDRIVPAFRPDIALGAQSMAGVPVHPAVVVTVHQAAEVVGSRALAPGEEFLYGSMVVQISGFAPVLRVRAWRGSWLTPAFIAVTTMSLGVILWGVVKLVAAARRKGLSREHGSD